MKGNTDMRSRNIMAAPTRTDKRSEEHVGSGELLPGIPNEVTLDLITPKLPWRAFNVLSSVSRCWQEAIQTKKVYEARVRANSTEALVVYSRYYAEQHNVGLGVYSTREKCSHELPPIPWLPGPYETRRKFIALDGKVYVFGERWVWEGERDGRVVGGPGCTTGFDESGQVNVLDLATRRGWKQCANMLEARSGFTCGAMDGKIYVFGGTTSEGNVLLRSEVYDTQENAWSPIMPLPTGKRFEQRVATVRKELFVYETDMSTLSIYNPAKNEWRLVELFSEESVLWPVFMKNEKFYSISHSGIDVYDVQQQSWIQRHTNSFGTAAEDFTPVVILDVKDELLLIAIFSISGKSFVSSLQCKGFDTEKKQIVWERTNITNSTPSFQLHCSIEL